MNGSAWFEETQGFAPWAYVLISLVFLVLLSVLTLRQTTTVAEDAVTVRFGPFYKMRIPFSEIAHAEAVSYRPVREYGGWGIRGLGRKRALNTRGNLGVLVTRADERADDGELVHHLRDVGHQFADLDAGDFGLDRLKLAAHVGRRVRLRIPDVDVARSALQE